MRGFKENFWFFEIRLDLLDKNPKKWYNWFTNEVGGLDMLFAVIGIVLTFLIFFASSSVHLRIQRAFGEKAVRLYKKITLIVIVSYYCAVLILSLIGLIFTRHLQKEAIYLLLSISPFIQLLWCNGALFVSWIYRKRKT